MILIRKENLFLIRFGNWMMIFSTMTNTTDNSRRKPKCHFKTSSKKFRIFKISSINSNQSLQPIEEILPHSHLRKKNKQLCSKNKLLTNSNSRELISIRPSRDSTTLPTKPMEKLTNTVNLRILYWNWVICLMEKLTMKDSKNGWSMFKTSWMPSTGLYLLTQLKKTPILPAKTGSAWVVTENYRLIEGNWVNTFLHTAKRNCLNKKLSEEECCLEPRANTNYRGWRNDSE